MNVSDVQGVLILCPSYVTEYDLLHPIIREKGPFSQKIYIYAYTNYKQYYCRKKFEENIEIK